MSEQAEDRNYPLTEVLLQETVGLPERPDGLVIGRLVAFTPEGMPQVEHAYVPFRGVFTARTTVRLERNDVGSSVVLAFEGGDWGLPIILGKLLQLSERMLPTDAQMDGKQLIFEASQEIVLKCGKSSLTLTREGKVLIRGAYVLSRSSGVNRIKGGSVQIN